ncbi:MAG: hypothetical protein WCK76_10755 [Elusimicrobiota bacterium]
MKKLTFAAAILGVFAQAGYCAQNTAIGALLGDRTDLPAVSAPAAPNADRGKAVMAKFALITHKCDEAYENAARDGSDKALMTGLQELTLQAPELKRTGLEVAAMLPKTRYSKLILSRMLKTMMDFVEGDGDRMSVKVAGRMPGGQMDINSPLGRKYLEALLAMKSAVCPVLDYRY